MAPTPLVDNAQIKHAELLRPLPFFLHAYVWPFAFAWPVFLRYYLSQELYDKHIGGEEWTFVWMGSIITVQSLFWLSTHWSVNLEARFKASKVKTIEEAQLIKVLPVANAGSAEVCKLIRDKVRYSRSYATSQANVNRLAARQTCLSSSRSADSSTTPSPRRLTP